MAVSPAVIAGTGRTRASRSSVSASASRFGLWRRGMRGAPAAIPVSPAARAGIRGTTRDSRSWGALVSSDQAVGEEEGQIVMK